MSDLSSVLIIIPARGGSKGIPRKNLRPLRDKPLLSYSIRNALASRHKPVVCVSSEDREILALAETFGAIAVMRPESLGADAITLDPVIHHAVEAMEARFGISFELVVTMQPTSPLLKTSTLDAALDAAISDGSIDTVISAKKDTHLSWGKSGERFVPNYRERLNRQQLPQEFRETGGFFISRRRVVGPSSRIGSNVTLHLLEGPEAIDIDDYEDWALCEYHLRRKKVLFVVAGYPEIGLGHVYNAMLIAHEILEHDVEFLVDSKSRLAYKKIQGSNYPVTMQAQSNLVDDIAALNPDVVINDRLDTDDEYIKAIKSLGKTVINFEDLGSGCDYADLVINAIYPEKELRPNHFFGHAYFALRDEFLLAPRKRIEREVREVLLTFGGVDPNNYTLKTLSEIYQPCRERGIAVKVVTGFGYSAWESLARFEGVEILRDVVDIAKRILSADIVFTSAGRTTYEIASIGTPAIVLAQNEREMTHFFADQEYGFLNLGLGYGLPDGRIGSEFLRILDDFRLRRHMSELMLSTDLRNSKKNVIKLIKNIVVGEP